MTAKILWANLGFQFRSLRRQPAFWGPTVVLPALLYAMFGVTMMGDGRMAPYAVGAFSVYAVAGVAFFQFGVGMAQDREAPFEAWRRRLPNAVWPHWIAQVLVAGVFAMAAMTCVVTVGIIVGGFVPHGLTLLGLFLSAMVISVPAGLMGILLGLCTSGHAATAVAMLIFLPMSYLGGLWVPVNLLPQNLQSVSWLMPTRHMVELVWAGMGLDQRGLWRSIGLLFLDAVIVTALCRWRLSKLGHR
jgi:ABC-2 type transport system permease protein